MGSAGSGRMRSLVGGGDGIVIDVSIYSVESSMELYRLLSTVFDVIIFSPTLLIFRSIVKKIYSRSLLERPWSLS